MTQRTYLVRMSQHVTAETPDEALNNFDSDCAEVEELLLRLPNGDYVNPEDEDYDEDYEEQCARYEAYAQREYFSRPSAMEGGYYD